MSLQNFAVRFYAENTVLNYKYLKSYTEKTLTF